jgi:hypothetical protein
MTRYLTLVVLALFGMMTIAGCHASGEVGSHSSVISPR